MVIIYKYFFLWLYLDLDFCWLVILGIEYKFVLKRYIFLDCKVSFFWFLKWCIWKKRKFCWFWVWFDFFCYIVNMIVSMDCICSWFWIKWDRKKFGEVSFYEKYDVILLVCFINKLRWYYFFYGLFKILVIFNLLVRV